MYFISVFKTALMFELVFYLVSISFSLPCLNKVLLLLLKENSYEAQEIFLFYVASGTLKGREWGESRV